MAASIHLLLSEDTHQVYNVKFYDSIILTTVTHVPYVVDDWIKTIKEIHRPRLKSLIVGLDIEWSPNRTRGTERNPVAILQLCIGRNCLIFQLLYAEALPKSLTNFLENEDYVFVGGGIHDDVKMLVKDFSLKVKNRINLQDLVVGKRGKIKLKELASRVLGKIMEKPSNIATSDWSVGLLSEAQVQYACIDAFVSFEIGRVLLLPRRPWPSAL